MRFPTETIEFPDDAACGFVRSKAEQSPAAKPEGQIRACHIKYL
jgi:hypothetical protein